MPGFAIRSLAASVLVAAVAGNCFEKYQCIFHHDINGQEYSWDLHQLCHENGDYVNADANGGHSTFFNICGNASQVCAPGYPTFDTHGVAVQLDTSSDAPICNETAKACVDYDTGLPTCCTQPCYVLVRLFTVPISFHILSSRHLLSLLQGTEFFQFYLNNPTDPDGGVKLVHSGMPSL